MGAKRNLSTRVLFIFVDTLADGGTYTSKYLKK